MKKYLFLWFLSAMALCAETLDLGSRGKLTLYLPDGWKTAITDMAGQMTLTVTPRGDENASMTMLIIKPDSDAYDTKPRLKMRVEIDAYGMAEQSVEKRAVAKEFSLQSGFGFFCSFTDAALRGKPSVPGNYKVATVGKIRLAPDVLVDVSILADAFRDRAYQDLLGAIEGMEYQRR